MPKERIIWLDNLKVFLILMVVLGHTLLFTNHEGTGNLPYRIISSFWMPLFMFTSGFSSYRVEQGWDVVKKRFFQLMIPFLSWSVVVCAIQGTYHLEKMFLYPTESMWFLYALFFIILIHVLTCKVAKRVGIKEELLVLIVAAVLWGAQRATRCHFFATDLISYHFVFYSLGFYFRKYYDHTMRLSPVWFYLLGFGFIVMAFFHHESYYEMMQLPSSLHIIYDFICAFLSLAPFVYVFSRWADVRSRMSIIGGGTLGIYVFHLAIYKFLQFRIMGDLYLDTTSTIFYYLLALFIWQAIFWLSYSLTFICRKNHLLSLLLLGSK